MKNLSLIASALAMLGLTACEKGLVDDVADVAPAGQAANSVLQVRTRSGGSAGEEATVAYPIAVYVFAGEECKAVQTIAPLWQALTVGGTFATAGTSSTIALTRQEDNRTWTLPSLSGDGSSAALPSHQGEGPGVGSVFLLPPSSQPASVSVNITIGGATKTYTYSCSDQLEAGYRINIDGTYTEAVGVNLFNISHLGCVSGM